MDFAEDYRLHGKGIFRLMYEKFLTAEPDIIAMWRLRKPLSLSPLGEPDAAKSEAYFERALTAARQQQAKIL
jgi:hypothetical protein